MANPNRANGFKPVGLNAASGWNGKLRRITAADRSSDTTNSHGHIFVGDPIKLSSGKAAVANSNDTILGVCVAVGKSGSVNGGVGPYNPDSLSSRYAPLADATGWFVWYIPADGQQVFEGQSASDLDYFVGSTADINTAANTAHGSTTTGLSNAQLTTSSNADVTIVNIPLYEDNDSTLANTRYHFVFTKTAFEQ